MKERDINGNFDRHIDEWGTGYTMNKKIKSRENNNENESGIDEWYKRNFNETGDWLYEKYKQQQTREYIWEECNKWEQSRGNTNRVQKSTLGSQKENAFWIDRYKQEEVTIRNQRKVNENLIFIAKPDVKDWLIRKFGTSW